MIKTLSKAQKMEREKFRIPRSVQDAIPIRRIFADGIFQVGNQYSKTWSFTDINYAIASKEDKTSMFLDYSELLNALDSGASAKITIYNRRINKAEFERSVLLPDKDDGLDEYRHEFNQMLTAQVTGTSNSIVRERYLTVSVVKRNADEARSYFARVGTDLVTHLAQLSSVAIELTLNERMHIFRDFFKAGEQAAAEFNIHEHAKRGQHFKDWFCPDSMEFAADHFKIDDRYGRVLLRAQDAWVEDLDGDFIYEPDEDGNLQVTAKSREQAVKLGETMEESTYELFHTLGLNGQYAPERTAQIQTMGAYVSSTYPPVTTTPLAYVPQAIGISVARLLGLNTVCLLYFGRFCNLIFFVIMLYLSMKRIPFGKEVLLGVAVLPMTLHLAASFSYDVMILSCMFLLTAVCLDLAYEKEQVRVRDIVLLAVLAAVAGPCKMVYAPMLGLCLLIPMRKFGKVRNWFISAFAVGTAWAMAMYLVNSQVIATYAAATEADSYVEWAGEAGFSMSLLIHNPVLLVRMFYQTLLWNAKDMHITMIGGWLGNLDQVLDVPYLAVWAFTLCLIGLALKIPGEQIRMNMRQRVWTGFLCAACGGLTMLSMLIAWTPVSSRVILGVQGRYFLPFLPVLLLALKNRTVVLTKDKNRSILYLMCCLNGYALVRLFSIVCIRL